MNKINHVCLDLKIKKKILLNQAGDHQNIQQFQCSASLCKSLRNSSVQLERKTHEGNGEYGPFILIV